MPTCQHDERNANDYWTIPPKAPSHFLYDKAVVGIDLWHWPPGGRWEVGKDHGLQSGSAGAAKPVVCAMEPILGNRGLPLYMETPYVRLRLQGRTKALLNLAMRDLDSTGPRPAWAQASRGVKQRLPFATLTPNAGQEQSRVTIGLWHALPGIGTVTSNKYCMSMSKSKAGNRENIVISQTAITTLHVVKMKNGRLGSELEMWQHIYIYSYIKKYMFILIIDLYFDFFYRSIK